MGIDTHPVSRRRLLELGALGALSVVGIAACGSDDGSSAANASKSSGTSGSGSSGTTSTTAGATTTTAGGATTSSTDNTVIPEETAGPYPGDGSNGPDVLSESGVVRTDITSSFGSSTTKVDGVPAKIRYELVNANNGQPLQNAAVYTWHCDGQGRYSMYSNGVTNENFLRGVQSSGSDGVVAFDSIFPGCYSGRWPHVHFEVYPSTSSATSASGRIATSQIAIPREVCESVYSNFSGQYPGSSSNLSQLSLDTDMVFRDDGAVHELATVGGDANSGYTLTLRVPVLVSA
ncbi:MAG: 3,4-dioxygenase subunit beta [Acidimicrobiia bacterium]